MTSSLRIFSSLLLALVAACSEPATPEPVFRDDLQVVTLHGGIRSGLSNRFTVEVPEGYDSMLIEVQGEHGLYYLTELLSPSGDDLIESARLVTRGAREIPGLVDWLYPNASGERLVPGAYELVIRARDALSGDHVGEEDLEVRIYMARAKEPEGCGLHLDFLIDDVALDATSQEAAIARVVTRLDESFRQVGMAINDYQMQRVDMSDSIDLSRRSAVAGVDEILERARHDGSARADALHVLLVRRIGGQRDPDFDPAGYSMGLPGPYELERPNAAVLVATELFASESAELDADGLASSVAHELGHYLGLYHTSEPAGSGHDPIDDSDECEAELLCSREFRRNIMTSSQWLLGAPPGTRDLFSQGQGEVMRRHPLCVPREVEWLSAPVDECTLACAAPNTCVVFDRKMECAPACDPKDPMTCDGSCEPDELGTYTCREQDAPSPMRDTVVDLAGNRRD